MNTIFTNLDIAAAFRTLAVAEGEVVWNRQIVAGNRRYSLPFMSTSRLANHFEHSLPLEHEPNAWVVDSSDDREWRFYTRVGEDYGEGWVHHFAPPVTVAVKSPQEFLLTSRLPKSHWWQAEFVCPYCSHLCWDSSYCSHLIIARHSVKNAYRSAKLVSILQEMGSREFNCNMLNADIPGLKIKVPRNFIDGEWFRFAYWYVHNSEILDHVEQIFMDGKQAVS